MTCRFCHSPIHPMQFGWASGIQNAWCPNSIIGLHEPFTRADAVLAIGFIYWNLRNGAPS